MSINIYTITQNIIFFTYKLCYIIQHFHVVDLVYCKIVGKNFLDTKEKKIVISYVLRIGSNKIYLFLI